ncbi:MAG: SUMF1/EgtB/PvdO family nonheme iron enzyme [Proteobacteria bacterium]|nr:SUMF1/EgtB/PvdO family nonheme iron enzyme [Pseudomonadota bacterium]
MPIEAYQLEDEAAARGAQGSVYFGVRHIDGLEVAVKVAGADTQTSKALMHEMEILKTMQDSHVQGVAEYIESIRFDGRLAMVMPRYPHTMAHWLGETIQNPDAYSLDDTLARIAELARIVGDVHQVFHGGGTVVHRDIKPENVFLDGEGRPYVGDFGGAMTIDELKVVELALFGTPMWAPLDQLLPEHTIPDTTWDTYAMCVMLYAAITGARPAYQADPTELLTPLGQDMWEAAAAAVSAGDPRVRRQWHKKFLQMRRGTATKDLIELTGRSALLNSDRKAIENGVHHLAQLAGIRPMAAKRISQTLWTILIRGLSPLSHPSPPNRYRDALEFADELEDLREIAAYLETTQEAMKNAYRVEPLQAATAPPPTSEFPKPVLLKWVLAASLATATITICAIVFVWATSGHIARFLSPGPMVVQVPGEVPFWIDRTEVTVKQWESCVEAGICPRLDQTGGANQPAMGLSHEDASSFCQFVNGDLPTVEQWSTAAGPAKYPWGNQPPTCAHATGLNCATHSRAVGSTPKGVSKLGVADMAGNAWEWVRDINGVHLLIGGSYLSAAPELGVSGRRIVNWGDRPADAGARCVYQDEP